MARGARRRPAPYLRAPATQGAGLARGFFAVAWLLTGHEAYAWSLALAPDPEGVSQRMMMSASDQQILDDLAVCPLPK
jgi:hypothetical protein